MENWSSQNIANSCTILEFMLEISIDYKSFVDNMWTTEDLSQIHFFYLLLSKGEKLLELLKQLGDESLDMESICNELYLREIDEVPLAKAMCKLRGTIASFFFEKQGNVSGTCIFNASLCKLIEFLLIRNINIHELVQEEKQSSVSVNEVNCVHNIEEYITSIGWESVPIGEREESILCLAHHYFSRKNYGNAFNILVQGIEIGLTNPLIYYFYYKVAAVCKKYEEAINGYNAAVEAMPSCALLPTDRYKIEKIFSDDHEETIYTGKDLYTEASIFIKELKLVSADTLQNIKESNKVKHSKILELLDIREINQRRPIIVYEYFEGKTLEQVVKEKGCFDFENWKEISFQILGAVSQIHDFKVIHGNLSPKNIFLNEQNSIKICNLGSYSSQEALSLNDKAHNIYYYAPESILEKKFSEQSDVYSLGKILYYMLTGEIPHVVKENAMSEIFYRSSEYDKSKRYQNAEEMFKNFAVISSSDKKPSVHVASPAPQTETQKRTLVNNIELPDNFSIKNNEIFNEKDGSIMVLIPEGFFSMGSEERNSESPVHEVELNSYLIDKYPVTNKQYTKFLTEIGKSGSSKISHPKQNKASNFTPKLWNAPQYSQYSSSPNHPVVFVDWWDAWAYAKWVGKDLPTEAEWEKAARGNDQRAYPWGSQPPSNKLANFGGQLGHTTPVGAYVDGVSPYGCYDMSGNVWEWCADTYEPFFYQSRPSNKNPINQADKPSRSLRGGSWNDATSSIRTTVRGCWMNIVRYGYIGFRCVYRLP